MTTRKVVPSYPLWDRFPPPSRLHLVVGVLPALPKTKYIPVWYLYETQCQMRVRQLIDVLTRPFNWPGLQEAVLDRAGWFFDVPTEDGAIWAINDDWRRAKRYMEPWYWLGLNDLMAAVQGWLVEYDQWKVSRRPRVTVRSSS